MRSHKSGFGFVLLFFVFQPVHADDFLSLNTRTDVIQKLAIVKPVQQPVASVILIAGGSGKLNISQDDDGTAVIGKDGNFLVRSRDLFAQQGFVTAVIDAPSDRYSKQGMKMGFRDSAAHRTDLNAVIDYLTQTYQLPVWVIGTSRGTESTAQIAIHTGNKLKGIVLTASMSEENRNGTSLPEMDLEKITVPTLLVAHEDDGCEYTPASGAKTIKSKLTKALVVELKLFKGGDEPITEPCKAKSQHGFFGIESQVVDYIGNFIKQHSR